MIINKLSNRFDIILIFFTLIFDVFLIEVAFKGSLSKASHLFKLTKVFDKQLYFT